MNCLMSICYSRMKMGFCTESKGHLNHLNLRLQGLNCRDIQTCDQCQKNSRCGWCDDGSGTGLGVCLEGSAAGPIVLGSSAYSLNNTICPVGQWYFTSCPGEELMICFVL
ncbi:attractin [Trichonephila clavipes]|nr:attractin [Trichonephila clavipes]